MLKKQKQFYSTMHGLDTQLAYPPRHETTMNLIIKFHTFRCLPHGILALGTLSHCTVCVLCRVTGTTQIGRKLTSGAKVVR